MTNPLPPNYVLARFQQLSLELLTAEAELDMLRKLRTVEYRRHMAAVTRVSVLRAELAAERTRIAADTYDEGERQQRVRVLTDFIARLPVPALPDQETYRTRIDMLVMRIWETYYATNCLLIWQIESGPQN